MCGIVGVMSENILSASQEKMFKDMLIVDQLRGEDGVGILFVSTAWQLQLEKSLLPPNHAIAAGSKEPGMGFLKPNRAILGHNRAATVGKVSKENCHPFHKGNVVGMHNGTLTIRHTLEDYKDFKVDSENIFHHIDKKGVKDLWSKLQGAAALVWWEDNSLKMLRNKHRPLHFAYNKAKTFLAWASEPYMILLAAYRNGVDIELPTPIIEDTLYTFKQEAGIISCSEETIDPYVAPPFTTIYEHGGTSDYYMHGQYCANDAPIKPGDEIIVMFDEFGDYHHRGWCTTNDKVNVIANRHIEKEIIPESPYTTYTATVESYYKSYYKGVPEWTARVSDVVPQSIAKRKSVAAATQNKDQGCHLCTIGVGKHCKECKEMNGQWKIGLGKCDFCQKPSDKLYYTGGISDFDVCPRCFSEVLTGEQEESFFSM